MGPSELNDPVSCLRDEPEDVVDFFGVKKDGVRGLPFRRYDRYRLPLYSGYSRNRIGLGDLHYPILPERRILPVLFSPVEDLVPRRLTLVLSENSSSPKRRDLSQDPMLSNRPHRA